MTPRLGDILIARGFVTERQLQDALASHDARGGRLGAALVKQGLISVPQLGDALAEQFKVPFRQIEPADVNLQVVRLLPEGLARDRQTDPPSHAVEGIAYDALWRRLRRQPVQPIVDAADGPGQRFQPRRGPDHRPHR